MGKLGLGALLSLVLLVIPAGCSSSISVSDKTPIVRVRILQNQDQVVVASSGSPLVRSTGEVVSHRVALPHGVGVSVSLSPGGWHVGGTMIPAGELTIQPEYVGSVSINGSAYRGQYRFVPLPGGANRFDVVNDVDVDSYVASVVRGELPEGWHPETYKAQAIVARTYALYEAHTVGAGRYFDLEPDVRSQVYGGTTTENPKSRQAVNDTAGVVVAYGPAGQEKIFKAYFGSCCGGAGQSAYDAFGDPDIPPLKGTVVGTLCSASSRFNWNLAVRKDELTRRMRLWGARHSPPHPLKDMGMLVRIDVAPGGVRNQRPVRFLVLDNRGLQYSLSGEELRWACNADAKPGTTLNSSFMKPVATADTIQFIDGHGWGHGVGMCQWCAEARAQQGIKHEQIVLLAYPGAVMVRAY